MILFIGRPRDARLRELTQCHTEEAIGVLVQIMRDELTTPTARITACRELLDRAWGRATQPIEAEIEEEPVLTRAERVLIARNLVREAFGRPLLTIEDIRKSKDCSRQPGAEAGSVTMDCPRADKEKTESRA